MKQRMLICGATGFIGRNLLERFSKDDRYEVHATHFKRDALDYDVTWHHADLRDPAVVDELVKGKDIILQAAATTSGAADIVNHPYLHVTDNAIMNSYLFRSAHDHKVKKVVFFSCTVMYQSSGHPLLESDFDANQDLYPNYFGVGHTKLYLEKMCEFYSHFETQYTVIRHSNIYGPYDKFDLKKSHVFGATLTKVMQAEDEVEVWGDGGAARDLLYVDDLVDFVNAALNKQEKPYGLYNCGLGEAIAIRDLVKKIIDASGKDLSICFDTSKPSLNTTLCLDTTKAFTELSWTPRVTLEEGIKKTLAWWKENIGSVIASRAEHDVAIS